MKNLKTFVGRFCSDWMVKQAIAMQQRDSDPQLLGPPPDSAGTSASALASPGLSDGGALTPGAAASAAAEEMAGGIEGEDYLAGLGAKFKYPGDPRK